MQHVQEKMVQACRDTLSQYKEDWTEEAWGSQAEATLTEGLQEMLATVERRHLAATGIYIDLPGGLEVCTYDEQAWSPDGSRLLLRRKWKSERIPRGTNGKPADLVFWDAAENKEGLQLEQAGHDGPIMWSGVSPDGKWAASSCWDKKVRVWDALSGSLQYILVEDANNQSWTGRFSPNSQYLAAGNGDAYLRIWQVATGKMKHKLSIVNVREGEKGPRGGWIRGIEFSKNSETVFCSNFSGNVGQFSMDTGLPIQLYLVESQKDFPSPSEVSKLNLSHTDNCLAFRSGDGNITSYRWDKNEKWQVEQTLQSQCDLRKSSWGMVNFLDEDGKLLVSLDREGVLRVWTLSD